MLVTAYYVLYVQGQHFICYTHNYARTACSEVPGSMLLLLYDWSKCIHMVIILIRFLLKSSNVGHRRQICVHGIRGQHFCVLCSIIAHSLRVIRAWFAKAAANYIISDRDQLPHTFCERRKGRKVRFSGGICPISASLIETLNGFRHRNWELKV